MLFLLKLSDPLYALYSLALIAFATTCSSASPELSSFHLNNGFSIALNWSGVSLKSSLRSRNLVEKQGASEQSGVRRGIIMDSASFRLMRARQLASRRLNDFKWSINASAGYPKVFLDDSSPINELQFSYDFTGTVIPGTKYLKAKLLKRDCSKEVSIAALRISSNLTNQTSQKYLLDIDVLQDTITATDEYVLSSTGTTASIYFCLRIDYFYNNGNGEQSVNFYEDNVTVSVDWTTEFDITDTDANRVGATKDGEVAKASCMVQTYYCNNTGYPLSEKPTFYPGSAVELCVAISGQDSQTYRVTDIISMNISQVNNVTGAVNTADIITGAEANGLSYKNTRNGIVFIKHQLESKFFDDPNPPNPSLLGVAACPFGPLQEFEVLQGFDFTVGLSASSSLSRSSLLGVVTVTLKSIEECKEYCRQVSCQAFRSISEQNDAVVECTFHDIYPEDTDVEPSSDPNIMIFKFNNRYHEIVNGE